MPIKLLMIAIGGASGAMARYGVSHLAHRWWGSAFPWGTFTVNMLGCFFFGLIAGTAQERAWISPNARMLLLTGFMGAFTTFSTYAFESSGLLRDAQWLPAAANLLGQTALGLFLVIAGLKLAQFV